MTRILRIDPARIHNLSSNGFTRLCNDLIRAEASLLGIRQELIDTTIRDQVPDGGIDAIINYKNKLKEDWIPPGKCVWQYKSGNCPSAQQLEKKELSKDGVTKAIKSGNYYCFLTADSITAQKKERIRVVIENRFLAHGKKPRYRIYSADDIAEWIADHIAVLTQHFGIYIQNWQIFMQWASSPEFGITYFPDSQRKDLINTVRDFIQSKERIFQLTGKAGVGKTRAVFEAVNEEGLLERILYLDDANIFFI